MDRRRRLAIDGLGLRLPLLGLLLAVASCGGGDTAEGSENTADGGENTAGDGEEDAPGGEVDDETATVAVRLEAIDGFFIEGFEVGLRFERGDGEVIASTLWTDAVLAKDPEPSLEAYYETVVEQEVPAGEVVVLATANIGAGPGPEIPDLDGDLACRLPLTVADGEVVAVEVSFAGTDCLRVIDG